MRDELALRFEQLTEEQRACLRLVRDNYKSKEMARLLGITPHQADRRVAKAMHILGAARREEAARLLAEVERESFAREPVALPPGAFGLIDNGSTSDGADVSQVAPSIGRTYPRVCSPVDVGGHASTDAPSGRDTSLGDDGDVLDRGAHVPSPVFDPRTHSTGTRHDLRRPRGSLFPRGGPDHDLTPFETYVAIIVTTVGLALASVFILLAVHVALNTLQHIVGRPPPPLSGALSTARAAKGRTGGAMSKERHASRQMVAHQAAAKLNSIEIAVDAALHELGNMCAELPRMRQDASLAASFGQELFESAGHAYAALAAARGHTVRLHEGFERVRLDLRLAPARAGSGTDKPPQDQSITMHRVA